MATVAFRRPARRTGPEMPHGEITLQEPPAVPEVQSTGMRVLLMVVPMAMMGAGMATMGLGQVLTQSGDRKHKVGGERRDYLRYLSRTRRQVRGYAEKQRAALAWRHPDPESLWSLAMTSRLWERRPTHPDFGEVRVGTGAQRLAVRITPLQTSPVEDLEPVSAKALRRFTSAYTTVPGQPVALFIRGFARIQVDGDRGVALGMVRALLARMATFHAPDEVSTCRTCSASATWSGSTRGPSGRPGTTPTGFVAERSAADNSTGPASR